MQISPPFAIVYFCLLLIQKYPQILAILGHFYGNLETLALLIVTVLSFVYFETSYFQSHFLHFPLMFHFFNFSSMIQFLFFSSFF